MIRKRLGVLYRYCLPNKIQPRVDCYRAINSWRGAEAIFIHVPKVAGVSVSMSLYDKTLGHIRACDIKKYYPEDFENFFSFAFVREPSERFLSAIKYLDLNYQRLKGSPGMPSNRSLLTDPDRLVDQWLLHQDMSTVNNVFKRQSDFLCDESGNLLVDYVTTYESLEKGVAYVSEKIGKEISLGRLNSTAEAAALEISESLKSKIRAIYKDDCTLYESLV